MPAYEYQQRYRSSYGQGDAGDRVELTEQQAADINRDSPGTLAPVAVEEPPVEEIDEEPEAEDEEPETRALDAPPKHRQVTGGRTRGRKTGGEA
jgi:hypothetical protein